MANATAAIGKAMPVFIHYLVGGMSSQEQAAQDVAMAQSMGFDAFALNVADTQAYTMTTLGFLFAAALAANFQLFFSFDMTHFTWPSQYFHLIQQYSAHAAYYQHAGKPFVSTFYGGTLTFDQPDPNAGWDQAYKVSLASTTASSGAAAIDTYFVPSFNDNHAVEPAQMYNTFGTPDGLFCWDSAWPEIADGKVNVSSTIDQQYRSAADAAGKTFMMSWSSLQFKHMSQADNWYRRGELTIVDRIAQLMEVRPDFVEVISFNDGGESHYVGNLWPEAYTTAPEVTAYTNNYNHSAWGYELYKPAITALKQGATSLAAVVPLDGRAASGAFWYRTLLTSATCASDPLLKPTGWANAEDVVNVAVLLAPAHAGALVKVYSGASLLATYTGVAGLNSWSAPGLGVGAVKVVVTSAAGAPLVSGTSTMTVQADAALCNYNYQVVALA